MQLSVPLTPGLKQIPPANVGVMKRQGAPHGFARSAR